MPQYTSAKILIQTQKAFFSVLQATKRLLSAMCCRRCLSSLKRPSGIFEQRVQEMPRALGGKYARRWPSKDSSSLKGEIRRRLNQRGAYVLICPGPNGKSIY